MENEETVLDHGCSTQKRTNLFIISAVATQIKSSKKSRISKVSKMPEHENSFDHQRAFKEKKMLEMILYKGKTLDSKLQEDTMKERQIWKQVLTRLLDVMKFPTKQNLPFRGHRYVYNSNKGNFI